MKKKAIVTGGLGFIGSNFILKLLRNSDEYHITNVDAELYGSNIKNVSEIKDSLNYEFVKGNITNRRLMEELISKCDAVINFAAESFVDRSIVDPNSFLVSNIRGTFTILDIITKQKKRLVQISTDEVFGSLKSGTSDEKSVFNPSSPYAATKASAELLINSYVKTYNSDVVITRCTNNYGPRQHPEKLIPKLLYNIKNNKSLPIYGKGKNSREWIYVTDHCEALVKVLKHGKIGEFYNIGSNKNLNNVQICKYLIQIAKKQIKIGSKVKIKFVKDRPGHDLRYALNSTKIKKKLNSKNIETFQGDLTTKNNIDRFIKFGVKKFKNIHAAVHCSYPTSKKWGARLEDLEEIHLKNDLQGF